MSAEGRVRRVVAPDSVPVVGVRVLLHQIGTTKQGPIDSTSTDTAGGFRFRFQTDSGAIYLVSTRHDGIEFFSSPLNARADRPDTGIAIVIADTTSTGPASAAISVPVRHLVIARPGNDGLRNVLDMMTLRNTSGYTRVAPDSTRPAWSTMLPPMTEDLDVGQGDISAEAVERRGDSLLVFAPLSPGEKQIAVEYHLPRGRQVLALGFREPAERVNVLVEETEARVTGFHAATIDTQVVEGRTFRRWGGPVAAGDTIRIDFGGRGNGEQWVLLALVGVVLAALAVAAWRYRVLAILVIAVSATACHSEAGGARAIRIVDDAGDTTTLASPAKRVVSLMPATTELLFAIGAGDAVVGRTKWCDYPSAAAAVANVGDGMMPNAEAVVARHPDLVVFYRSAQNTAIVERLRSLGIAAVQLNVDALADIGRVATILGDLTGHERGADSLAAVVDSSLQTTKSPPTTKRPKVLLLVWEQPPMTIGRGSFLSELVERAGGANLFADIPSSSAAVSVEAIAARDPDLILLTAEGSAAFAMRPEWQVVRAVRERRFVRVSGSEFSHPGPRSPLAIAELTERLRDARP